MLVVDGREIEDALIAKGRANAVRNLADFRKPQVLAGKNAAEDCPDVARSIGLKLGPRQRVHGVRRTVRTLHSHRRKTGATRA